MDAPTTQDSAIQDDPSLEPPPSLASEAIADLGDLADSTVPSGVWLHIDSWFGSPAWLRSGTTLTPDGPMPIRISLADDLTIAANIVENANFAQIVERVAFSRRPLGGPGAPLSYVCAPTLADLLIELTRIFALTNPVLNPELVERSDRIEFVFRGRMPRGRLYSFLGLLQSLYTYEAVRFLVNNRSHDFVLRTSLPECDVECLKSILECRVEFRSERDSLEIPSDWCDVRNPAYDAILWVRAKSQADAMAFCQSNALTESGVRSAISNAIASDGRVPRMKQIANAHQVSSRTISRWLNSTGKGFRAIVDEERRSAAAELIGDLSLGLDDLAKRLGFSDTTSFGRTFRRWFGQTPGQYRKELYGTRVRKAHCFEVRANARPR